MIRKTILERIAADNSIKGALMMATGKDYTTIMRWASNPDWVGRANNPLSTASNLNIICKHYNLTQAEVLEAAVETATN